MKIGNISFNPESFDSFNEQQFKQMYRGKLDGIDINDAWNMIEKLQTKEVKNETKKKK
jgi:hypothetical protein